MRDRGKKERDVLHGCMAVLKELGIFAWRQNTGAFRTPEGGFFRSSMAGVSDILGILPGGRFLAVECKREGGGVVSEAQRDFLGRVSSSGGFAVVSDSAERLRETILKELEG